MLCLYFALILSLALRISAQLQSTESSTTGVQFPGSGPQSLYGSHSEEGSFSDPAVIIIDATLSGDSLTLGEPLLGDNSLLDVPEVSAFYPSDDPAHPESEMLSSMMMHSEIRSKARELYLSVIALLRSSVHKQGSLRTMIDFVYPLRFGTSFLARIELGEDGSRLLSLGCAGAVLLLGMLVSAAI
ncbi:hypothetical protein HYDPIDRAFT_24604 [Hydnomerulius pinastri MD-312]|nr:hypothetical protein HYDPIDRAFT_24604 [Hydnomerulius pinastri MD-312]